MNLVVNARDAVKEPRAAASSCARGDRRGSVRRSRSPTTARASRPSCATACSSRTSRRRPTAPSAVPALASRRCSASSRARRHDRDRARARRRGTTMRVRCRPPRVVAERDRPQRRRADRARQRHRSSSSTTIRSFVRAVREHAAQPRLRHVEAGERRRGGRLSIASTTATIRARRARHDHAGDERTARRSQRCARSIPRSPCC